MDMKEKYVGSGFSLYYKSRTKKEKTNLKACSKKWNNLPETEKKKYNALSSTLNEQFFEAKKKMKIEKDFKEEGAQTDEQEKSKKKSFAPDKLIVEGNVSSYSFVYRPVTITYYYHSPSQPTPPPSYSKKYYIDSEQVDYYPW